MGAFTDRKLLWKAWPDGYLAIRGVSTLNEYICVQPAGPVRLPLWCHWENWDIILRRDSWFTGREESESAEALVKAGDLLPNVDPTDVATWACLLADLAEALGQGRSEDGWEGYGVMKWSLSYHSEARRVGNIVINGNQTARTTLTVNGEDIVLEGVCTGDPALALVLARIKIREEKGR